MVCSVSSCLAAVPLELCAVLVRPTAHDDALILLCTSSVRRMYVEKSETRKGHDSLFSVFCRGSFYARLFGLSAAVDIQKVLSWSVRSRGNCCAGC